MEFRGHVLAEKATTLPREYYTSQEIFAAERDLIFARRWICLGRADRIPEPGDYVLAELAGESLIVARGEDRGVRAFFNVCRHRGTRLCEKEEGRLGRAIVCPYHAWSYGLDGGLLGAPNMSDIAWFDKGDYSLHAAAAGVWEGFLFVHLGRRPPPLEEALGPLLGRFAPWRLPALVSVRRTEYDVRANWKLIFQNFSECYHCPPVHPALAKLSNYRSGANNLREGPILGGYMLINESGGSLTMTGRMCGAPLGDLSPEERSRVYYYSIFPGFFLTVQPDFVMSTRLSPLAVDRTQIVSEWHFAPEASRAAGFDPSDGIELWDTTNRQDWHICELAQQGVSSRAYVPGPYSTQESLLAAFDREYLTSLGR
ncbi:MAG: aromatic ring-hydroxylating oxygenase subunit alpha [Thermoanaerobaculia bacterium]